MQSICDYAAQYKDQPPDKTAKKSRAAASSYLCVSRKHSPTRKRELKGAVRSQARRVKETDSIVETLTDSDHARICSRCCTMLNSTTVVPHDDPNISCLSAETGSDDSWLPSSMSSPALLSRASPPCPLSSSYQFHQTNAQLCPDMELMLPPASFPRQSSPILEIDPDAALNLSEPYLNFSHITSIFTPSDFTTNAHLLQSSEEPRRAQLPHSESDSPVVIASSTESARWSANEEAARRVISTGMPTTLYFLPNVRSQRIDPRDDPILSFPALRLLDSCGGVAIGRIKDRLSKKDKLSGREHVTITDTRSCSHYFCRKCKKHYVVWDPNYLDVWKGKPDRPCPTGQQTTWKKQFCSTDQPAPPVTMPM